MPLKTNHDIDKAIRNLTETVHNAAWLVTPAVEPPKGSNNILKLRFYDVLLI